MYNSIGIVAEHGISLLVKREGHGIIFDTGQSSAFIRNARTMGEDLEDSEYLVLSHGHFDHTGGVPPLMEEVKGGLTVVSHPHVFERKLDDQGNDVGCPVSLDEIRERFDVILTREVKEIVDGVHLLTEVPRTYEDPGTVVFHLRDGKMEPDPVEDDANLVVRTDKGLFIVCGCAHSGILNIVNHAVDFFDDEVYGIAGGLHLLDASRERVEAVIQRFEELGIRRIHPCHCTGIEATYLMMRELGAERISSGQCIEI